MQEEAPSAPAHTITSAMRYPQYCLHCGLVSRGRAACCSTVGVAEAVGKRGSVSAGDENGNWGRDGDWDVERYVEEDDNEDWDGRGDEERNGSGLGTGDVDEEGDRDENGDEDRDGMG